jgi:hypothetical protein
MADWTAITGIVVSGVVGPSIAATYAFLNQGRAQRHTRELADVAELRKLLTEASADLREAEGLRGVAGSAILTHGEFVAERAPDAAQLIRASAQKVMLQSARIALLLGEDHPVTVAHRDVGKLVEKALGTLLSAGYASDAEAREEWIAILDSEPVIAARKRFVTEAHRLVGSRIEPPKSTSRRRALGRESS